MIGKALDSNNDIIVKNGTFQLVKDGAETVQHVRTRLQFYLGEWFLDLTAGTPYFEQIFTKPTNLANIESILKEKILSTPGVSALLYFRMQYEGGNSRQLLVEYSAETEYGTINNTEVTINA